MKFFIFLFVFSMFASAARADELNFKCAKASSIADADNIKNVTYAIDDETGEARLGCHPRIRDGYCVTIRMHHSRASSATEIDQCESSQSGKVRVNYLFRLSRYEEPDNIVNLILKKDCRDGRLDKEAVALITQNDEGQMPVKAERVTCKSTRRND
jgi:hypothetical protein